MKAYIFSRINISKQHKNYCSTDIEKKCEMFILCPVTLKQHFCINKKGPIWTEHPAILEPQNPSLDVSECFVFSIGVQVLKL